MPNTTGKKYGGRKVGTPNKRSLEIADQLKALGCDPIEGMAKLAMDESMEPRLRGRMYSELAQYIAPKRKAVQHIIASNTHESWLQKMAQDLGRQERNNPDG